VSKQSTGGTVAFVLFLGVLVIGVLLWANNERERIDEQKERDAQFEGACIALDAERQGDVCVDLDKGTVVLTRKEFEAKQ
jgi:hypothetical protein